jgi:UDP-2,4-diacetamido-2,4,6-trideoxy-beta-L-altropyranose hydrolase
MQVAFRVDSSLQIGTGHVMRCLTLADALRERGAKCSFVCRPHTGHLLDMIKQRGHMTIALAPADLAFSGPAEPDHAQWLGCSWENDAKQTKEALATLKLDWLVVDHYALDRRWEQELRYSAKHLMVIDDLADRQHDCDVLLDQNLGRQDKDYDGLLSPKTKTFIGPENALLRPEFAQWREYSLQRRVQPKLQHLLITMGGVDKDNATGKVLQVLRDCDLPADLGITIVMGPTAPWLTEVQEQAAAMPLPTQVLTGVNNMAELMAKSDLAIGAAGSTSWERCALSLPTILLILATNQQSSALALQSFGAAHIAADVQQLIVIMRALLNPQSESVALKKMSQAAGQLTRGDGTSKVVKFLWSANV